MIEFSMNYYISTNTYIEGDIVTYTCENNSTITDDITCDGMGNWELPSLDCPSGEFTLISCFKYH